MTFLVVVCVPPASAQQPPPPPEASRLQLRVGPLTINPTIALTNIGFDSNVFNQSADLQPKSDFTFTVTPGVDLRLRALRTQLIANVTEDLVWYQTFSTERAANNAVRVGWLIPFNRLSFKVNARHSTLRDRPGFEIDARSQRTEGAYDGLMEVRVLPKTFVGVSAQRQTTDYDKDAVFLGTSLQNELNREVTGGGVSLRYQLTPITSVSLVATRTESRFEFSPLRDSNATVASAVIAFDPLGIISGTATFGYTSFEPVMQGLPNYKGPSGAVDVSYRVLGTMRIGVTAVRDVSFSYEIDQPYYVQTGVTGSVSRAVVGPIDVVGRAGIQRLAYRSRAGVPTALSDRVDNVTTYGGGIGYHMGRRARLGFNIDKSTRGSDTLSRRYSDFRVGSSVTYGL
jgi:hypothetical protein